MAQLKKIQQLSLRQVLVLFCATSILLTSLLVSVSARVYQREIQQGTARSVELYAEEQEHQLREELLTIHSAMYSLLNKEEILDYLSGSRGYRAARVRYITQQMTDLIGYVAWIRDLTLCSMDGSIIAMTSNDGQVDNFLLRYQLAEQIPENGKKQYRIQSQAVDQTDRYMLSIAVPCTAVGRTGVLFAHCTVESLFEKMGFFDKPFVLYQDKQVLYSGAENPPDAEEMEEYKRDQAEGFYDTWLYLRCPEADWDILIAMPMDLPDSRMAKEVVYVSRIALLIFTLIELAWFS